ncbi:S-adenosyl-L-methionine-dependent methyltransferase [Cylindrobasidium torrendii FP15055 ss-10]|uniref:DNA (cytosine-5-)-methyltransferase n=1 Tax=Cylindrobasidium torrendii FP15055 ss-10 TaxID=1314674 RepID=A0A0D7BQG5_9AGAR|nr:S-adenosyl-L-methionine-dependent methyltransferase [Cylindrobasidium torrendii FP15055 ss-10]
MPFGNAPSALDVTFNSLPIAAQAPLSAPREQVSGLHADKPPPKRKQGQEDNERVARRRVEYEEEPDDAYTLKYTRPYISQDDEPPIAEGAIDFGCEVAEGKPLRKLQDFSIHGRFRNRDEILLPLTMLDIQNPPVLRASGLVSHESNVCRLCKPERVDLGVIQSYACTFDKIDLFIGFETADARYWVIPDKAANQYKPIWKRFVHCAFACLRIIVWAGANPRGQRSEFFEYLKASFKTPLGDVLDMATFEDKAFVNLLVKGLSQHKNEESLSKVPAVRELLGENIHRVRFRTRKEVPRTNLDAWYLDALNQDLIASTTLVHRISRSWIDESFIKILGKAPRQEAPKDKSRKARRELDALKALVVEAKKQPKILRYATPEDYPDEVRVGDVDVHVGNVVLVKPGPDILPIFPEPDDTVLEGKSRFDYFLVGCVRYIKSNGKIHLQVMKHGSFTVMEQLAGDRELFLLEQCEEINSKDICGKLDFKWQDDKLDVHSMQEETVDEIFAENRVEKYFCRFKYVPQDASFVTIKNAEDEAVKDQDAPNNCPACLPQRRRIDPDNDDILPSGNGFAIPGRKLVCHVGDFVLFRDATSKSIVASIGRVERTEFLRTQGTYKVHLTVLGRTAFLECLPAGQRKDERHLFLSNVTRKVLADKIIKKVHCMRYNGRDSEEREEYLALSPDHFFAQYKFHSIQPESWDDRQRIPQIDWFECESCEAEHRQWRQKLENMKPYSYQVLDLFGGIAAFASGIADGSKVSKLTHAIEISPSAAKTIQKNYPGVQVSNQDASTTLRYWKRYMKARDVARRDQPNVDEDDLDIELPEAPRQIYNYDEDIPKPPRMPSFSAQGGEDGDIQVVVAGFPCQSHSSLNMYKEESDKKSLLILTTLSYVDLLRPRFVFFENVPGFLQYQLDAYQDANGQKQLVGALEHGGLKLIIRILLEMDYQVRFGLLHAAHYGAPQKRERFFLIAARRDGYAKLPDLPQPTHHWEKHPDDEEKVSLRTMKVPLLKDVNGSWRDIYPIDYKTRGNVLHKQVSIEAAIADLPYFDYTPAICDDMDVPFGQSRQDYPPNGPQTRFQYLARQRKPGQNEAAVQVTKCYTRALEAGRVQRVKEVPLGARADYRWFGRESHIYMMNNPESANARKGYSHGAYGRLGKNEVFNTITTNIGPTAKQSWVLHPWCQRLYTVRELARAQGLPDWYTFEAFRAEDDTRSEASKVLTYHTQIGNAVPWQVAQALGYSLTDSILESIDWDAWGEL